MIYLGTKFVVGIFRFAFPRFIGSILPYLSRRKQKCLLTRPRSTQVPWLLENQPFAPAAPGMARERRRAASTRLGKNHHRETMQGAGGGYDSTLDEFRAVLPVVATKEIVSRRRGRGGQRQAAPELRRPWDVELNPALTSTLGYSLPTPPFLRGSLIFI